MAITLTLDEKKLLIVALAYADNPLTSSDVRTKCQKLRKKIKNSIPQ